MTPADVLYQAEAAGCTILIRGGRPSIKGNPNAALLAALREHREGILELLRIEDSPETCGTCNAWVHPENGREDIGRLCHESKCPFKGGRRHG